MRTRFMGLGASVVLCTLLALVAWGGVWDGPASAAPGEGGSSFFAYMTGANEVPGRGTSSLGSAIFRVSGDGESVEYTVQINNVTNVVAGHIHLGGVGVNGPVVVTLFSGKPASGPQSVSLTGRFTAAELEGPLKGQPLSLLTTQMATNAYVNFHTNDGNMTPNEGSGDFPGGEVRGTIGSADANRLRTDPAQGTIPPLPPAAPTASR